MKRVNDMRNYETVNRPITEKTSEKKNDRKVLPEKKNERKALPEKKNDRKVLPDKSNGRKVFLDKLNKMEEDRKVSFSLNTNKLHF